MMLFRYFKYLLEILYIKGAGTYINCKSWHLCLSDQLRQITANPEWHLNCFLPNGPFRENYQLAIGLLEYHLLPRPDSYHLLAEHRSDIQSLITKYHFKGVPSLQNGYFTIEDHSFAVQDTLHNSIATFDLSISFKMAPK